VASLLKRTVVLSISRFASQAIVLVSPILLVRILSVTEYGKYREFLLYAAIAGAFVTFGVRHSLVYFLPKYPERERVWVTQAALFTLALSCVAVIVIFVIGDLVRAKTSFDFITLLQLYILFFFNLDFLESYWLGKKRTDLILYLSATRLTARMIVVVVAALLTSDARQIVISLILLECVRCVLVLAFATNRKWFTSGITRSSLKEQMTYFVPLGVGGIAETLNRRIGMLFVSFVLGAEALAFYVIGSFAVPIVNTLRGAIADVIFPEIVQLKHAEAKDALPLWQQATVWYCVLLFPMVVIFNYYADAVVAILFTEDYFNAIPVFSAYALLLSIYCFDFHLPLRVQNANRFFVIASVIGLSVNAALLYPMYTVFGLVGPVVAYLVSQTVFAVYLALQTSRLYKVRISMMVRWLDVAKVTIASLVCMPILMIGKVAVEPYLIRSVVFGAAYIVAYLAVLRFLGVWNSFAFLSSLFGRRILRRGSK